MVNRRRHQRAIDCYRRRHCPEAHAKKNRQGWGGPRRRPREPKWCDAEMPVSVGVRTPAPIDVIATFAKAPPTGLQIPKPARASGSETRTAEPMSATSCTICRRRKSSWRRKRLTEVRPKACTSRMLEPTNRTSISSGAAKNSANRGASMQRKMPTRKARKDCTQNEYRIVADVSSCF